MMYVIKPANLDCWPATKSVKDMDIGHRKPGDRYGNGHLPTAVIGPYDTADAAICAAELLRQGPDDYGVCEDAYEIGVISDETAEEMVSDV